MLITSFVGVGVGRGEKNQSSPAPSLLTLFCTLQFECVYLFSSYKTNTCKCFLNFLIRNHRTFNSPLISFLQNDLSLI